MPTGYGNEFTNFDTNLGREIRTDKLASLKNQTKPVIELNPIGSRDVNGSP
jgi:hypothetical protein